MPLKMAIVMPSMKFTQSCKALKPLTYTEQRADEEAEKAINALSVLPASEYKEALTLLAKFSVQRNY